MPSSELSPVESGESKGGWLAVLAVGAEPADTVGIVGPPAATAAAAAAAGGGIGAAAAAASAAEDTFPGDFDFGSAATESAVGTPGICLAVSPAGMSSTGVYPKSPPPKSPPW